jgi:hypothetical protein
MQRPKRRANAAAGQYETDSKTAQTQAQSGYPYSSQPRTISQLEAVSGPCLLVSGAHLNSFCRPKPQKAAFTAKSPQWSPLKNKTYEKALYFYSI